MVQSHAQQDPLQGSSTWWSFLRRVRLSETSQMNAVAYFSREFVRHPICFRSFLLEMEQTLKERESTAEQKTLAEQYLAFFSPLTDRFNLFEIKNRMDDLAFHVVDPEAYQRLSQRLKKYQWTYPQILERIRSMLSDILKKEGYDNFEIQARYKSLYSLSRKMKIKGEKAEFRPKDVFGFRVILKSNSEQECFDVVNRLHDAFDAVPQYFKNYISVPKINGYQSLHTGLMNVLPDVEIPIEVQVRTQEMHEFSEEGFLAHWLYGDQKNASAPLLQQERFKAYLEQFSAEKDDRVYCFSTKGDLFSLPKGSTLLDYAYDVHTQLGHHAVGGVVNGEQCPLTYVIQDGDEIHIETASTLQVNETWLDRVQSKDVKRHIRQALKHLTPTP